MKKIPEKYLLLTWALTAGVLLSLSWPPFILFPLVFIGFVPFLMIEDHLYQKDDKKSRLKLFVYAFIGFLTWNFLTTWWIMYATVEGAIMAFLANSLLMTLPLLFFHITRRQLGNRLGYISLLLYWIGFEYLHHQWEFTWPWLSLGNVFGMFPQIVQWYEYTGIFGGTLWILVLNILIFHTIKQYLAIRKENPGATKKHLTLSGMKITALILLPVALSLNIFWNYEETGEKIEVVIVQPNIDPYEMKFDKETHRMQMNSLLNLSRAGITPNTRFLVWPETSIPGSIDIGGINEDLQIRDLREFLEEFPGISLVAGINGLEFYFSPEEKTATARAAGRENIWYDAYNSAIFISPEREDIDYYHKSKLVPGVERMPYPHVLSFLSSFAIDLGGITGSLGTQKERSVFFDDHGTGVAPVICYESVYGDYMTGYIQNGAQAIFVVTNDGWWDDTPGYKQHLYFSSLRAIETRRSVARSANTGISSTVDQRGIIHHPTEFWVPAVLTAEITLNDEMTFYAKNGDIIGRTAGFVALLSLLITFVSAKTNKFFFRSSKLEKR